MRLKNKNRGNVKLIKAIDKLISDIENSDWNSQIEIKKERPDADSIHSDGFYFFNISNYRTMILVVFDYNKYARIIWVGSHKKYILTFKNNRNTIKKWLRDNEWI